MSDLPPEWEKVIDDLFIRMAGRSDREQVEFLERVEPGLVETIAKAMPGLTKEEVVDFRDILLGKLGRRLNDLEARGGSSKGSA